MIVAVIRPERLEAVKDALAEVEVFRMTVSDVQGFGAEELTVALGGRELAVPLVRRVKLEIGVNEAFVEPTVGAIVRAGRTGPAGSVGDGKVFVLPLEDCVRIRTGERGPEAI